MTLQVNATLRLSTQLLVELTNPGEPSETTVNTSVLDAAVADTQAVFLIETGIAYDDTDALHVAIAVQGVLVFLMQYSGITGRNTQQVTERWNRGLVQIATTRGSEQRISPTSSSTLDPSTERAGSRPDQDRSRWRGFVPNAVGGGDEDE